jgi:acetoin utilization protein AcuC
MNETRMNTTQDACAFVYAPQLSSYRLSETHPFKPLRLELTRSLLYACDLLSADHEVVPEPFAEAELLGLHDADFVAAVKAVSQGDTVENAARYGFGTPDNPIFAGMHETVMGVCGASVTALRLVALGQVTRAVNLSGGLHHAGQATMSGFCTYNDVALAIHEAVNRYGLRVAYLDLDAHHGDGVQDFFYESEQVLTLSLHESGQYLFPGTGFTYEVGRGAGRGLSVNLPLEPFTEDASYLELLRAVLPRALEVFQPDLIVLQTGADMHRHDPLSHLHLSVQGIAASYRLVSDLADRFCEGRLVVTGGGGYDPYRTVPRLWALLWSILSRQSAPSRVPEGWRSLWGERLGVALPETFADPVAAWPENPRREQVAAANRLTAGKLLAMLEPIWEERFGR